jgi:hypothetical protein
MRTIETSNTMDRATTTEEPRILRVKTGIKAGRASDIDGCPDQCDNCPGRVPDADSDGVDFDHAW